MICSSVQVHPSNGNPALVSVSKTLDDPWGFFKASKKTPYIRDVKIPDRSKKMLSRRDVCRDVPTKK